MSCFPEVIHGYREYAPDPLEPIFQRFEKASGWNLSPQARTILKEGLIAVHTDTLGLGPLSAAAKQQPLRDGISGDTGWIREENCDATYASQAQRKGLLQEFEAS